MADEPYHPHDRFFKEAFSQTVITSDFLQAYLPGPTQGKTGPELVAAGS